MGNYISRKEPDSQNTILRKKSSQGAVLSNVPGVAAPPKLLQNETYNKNHKRKIYDKSKNLLNQRQSQIDTLPRHTAGSAKLVASIANNKQIANNIDNDSKVNLQQTSSQSNENLSDFLDELKNKPQNKIKFDYIPSVSDNEEFEDEKPSSKQQQKSIIINNRYNQSDDDEVTINKTRLKLNKKRNKVFTNLLSLNEIENIQKSKILQQERQLQIQNMKLRDALIVHRSLTNFNDYEKHDDRFKYEKHYATTRPVKTTSMKKRMPMKFPSIITKYEPYNYDHYSTQQQLRGPNQGSFTNSSFYRPRRGNENAKIDLYLETTEDIVDSTSRFLSINQSINYLGQNRHNDNRFAPIDLKDGELDEIIKIIEEVEAADGKFDSKYYMNGYLIKRPGVKQQLDGAGPSFTIPEKLYKSYLNKKLLASQSVRASSSLTTTTTTTTLPDRTRLNDNFTKSFEDCVLDGMTGVWNGGNAEAQLNDYNEFNQHLIY
jgi:hypothetical protein